jgi:hypothetical protein
MVSALARKSRILGNWLSLKGQQESRRAQGNARALREGRSLGAGRRHFYRVAVVRRDESLPPLGRLDPPGPAKRPTPAPAWVALAAARLGLLMLIASVVFTLLPAGRHPVEELERLRPYSIADRFLPVPIYGITLAMFVGIVVLWQMRKEPRPLPGPMVAQRLQAWVGIVLSFLGAVVIYVYVAFRGPR